MTVAQQIAALLRSEPRGLFTATEIATRLKLKAGHVRKELHRMAREKKNGPPPLVRVHHGLYRAFTDPCDLAQIEDPPVTLHAIQCSCKMPQNRGWGPPQGETPTWGSLARRPAWTKIDSTGAWMRSSTWEGRQVEIAVFPSTGTVQVHLTATSNPILCEDFATFPTWLGATMQAYGLVWSDADVDFDNVEMNKDYRTLFISRPDRVSLRKFRNAWAQIYQKNANLLRTEIRVTRPRDERLSVRETVEILRTLSTKRPDPMQEPSPPPSDGWEIA